MGMVPPVSDTSTISASFLIRRRSMGCASPGRPALSHAIRGTASACGPSAASGSAAAGPAATTSDRRPPRPLPTGMPASSSQRATCPHRHGRPRRIDRTGARQLRTAQCPRRRRQRDADRPGGDPRTGPGRHTVRGRGRRGPDRRRLPQRTQRRCVDADLMRLRCPSGRRRPGDGVTRVTQQAVLPGRQAGRLRRRTSPQSPFRLGVRPPPSTLLDGRGRDVPFPVASLGTGPIRPAASPRRAPAHAPRTAHTDGADSR